MHVTPLSAAKARLALAALLNDRLAEGAAAAQWTNLDVVGRVGQLVVAASVEPGCCSPRRY